MPWRYLFQDSRTFDCILVVSKNVSDTLNELILLDGSRIGLVLIRFTVSKMWKSLSARGVSLILLKPRASRIESAWLNLSRLSCPCCEQFLKASWIINSICSFSLPCCAWCWLPPFFWGEGMRFGSELGQDYQQYCYLFLPLLVINYKRKLPQNP